MRPDAAVLVQGLDRLRETLFQRLDALEALAMEQAALLQQDVTEREETLRERVATLEAALARLQAEIKRKEQDWQSRTQELDADRRLLVESWERLEQERLDTPQSVAQPRPSIPERPPTPQPVYKPAGADDADDPVTRSILRQFQALKNDVRRNTKEPSGR